MSKEVQYGSMPQKVLDDISEMSYGGYVLFSFDEKAKPQVHAQISDDLNAMSLQYFIKNWSEAKLIPKHHRNSVYERNYLRHATNDVLTFTWGDIFVERNVIGRCIASIFKKELHT